MLMKKMFVILGLFVLMMFVVSCAPTGQAYSFTPKDFQKSLTGKTLKATVPKLCVPKPTGKIKCLNEENVAFPIDNTPYSGEAEDKFVNLTASNASDHHQCNYTLVACSPAGSGRSQF